MPEYNKDYDLNLNEIKRMFKSITYYEFDQTEVLNSTTNEKIKHLILTYYINKKKCTFVLSQMQ